MPDITATQMLLAAQDGDNNAVEQLFPLVYGELKTIAHRHLANNSLARQFSTTDLVHEAYLKLIDHRNVSWKSRTHFFAIGSRVMRQVLVDRARQNLSIKRGGGAVTVQLKDTLLTRTDDRHVLAVEEALQRLEEVSPQQSRIVEMRFFGGMTVEEVAEEMEMSKRWVEAEWTMIRAWLRAELSEN
ncbi:MAG: ECF-type sigma factor [Fuerstiella sp.]